VFIDGAYTTLNECAVVMIVQRILVSQPASSLLFSFCFGKLLYSSDSS
jgi:hypothetical protein